MLATHKLNKLDWLRDQGAHDKPRRRKMAHAPAPKPCRANLCTRAYMTQECQRSKLAKSAQRTSFKHTLLLLEGNPFQHYGNTNPSWLQTTPPSSLRIRHCNHMAQRWSPRGHTLPPHDRGNPSHELCSTTPSSAHSIQPANSRTRQHNCMGLPGVVAQLASLVAQMVVLWVRNHGGELCNTTTSCLLPKCSHHPR